MKGREIDDMVKDRRNRWLGAKLGNFRITVNRTNYHLYSQLLPGIGNCTIVNVSTLGASKRTGTKMKRSKLNALLTGRALALRSAVTGVHEVNFDRLDRKYHGIIRMVAEAARNYGLCF